MNIRKPTAFLLAGVLCVPFLASLPHFHAQAEESTLLDVSDFTIRDENLVYLGADYLNDVSVLFDEQDKVPQSPQNTTVDSAVFASTDKSKNWKPNWQSEYGEDSFYIDLGANYVITGICYLDTNGVQEWTVEAGEPFAWEEILTFSTDSYMAWQGKSIDSAEPTRYLRFSTGCGDSGVSELAIYGYKKSELTDAQQSKTAAKSSGSGQTNLTAGGAVGCNAFIDDPMTAIFAAGNVREYHNLNWLIDTDGKIKFTQDTWGDMDSYYTSMKEQNISIIPCFQGGSSYIYGDSDYPEIAAPKDADTLDPKSYTLHAQAMYQVAARYGSNSDIDTSTLNVADSKDAAVGMGLLNALENCNEPNKTWSGKSSYYSPYELAAMCSADYDGHEGTIANAGVKTADPNFKLAVGGLLTNASLLDYLSEMKLWFDYHRSDGKFAVDIINIHLSPDTYNPEDSSFAENIQKVQAWIDENAPGTELWISEYEIPMTDCETDGTDNHDNEAYQEKYAQRVVRTNLIALKNGVDRITKFQLRDEGEGVYYNSGLVTQKGEWKKKEAWYAMACMTSVLENADFYADLSTDAVSIYRFKDRLTGAFTDCIWSPTNEDKVMDNYTLSVGNAAYAYLISPSEYAEGTTEALAVSDGTVRIRVTETPVYVTYSDTAKTIVNGKSNYIKPVSLCLSQDGSGETCDLSAAPSDSALNQFYRMFDEADTMPQCSYGDTDSLSTPETNVTSSGITCYVDLGGTYSITAFGIYDTYGTGSFEVYDANTDELLWSSDMSGYMSRSISLISETVPTDKLKIVKGGGDLNEFAIYGYAAEKTKTVIGDVNADGSFDIADVVMMQKWLLGVGTVIDREAGDLNADEKWNAFDLCLMKQMLN